MRVTAAKPELVVESGPSPSRSNQANGLMKSTRERRAVPDKTKMLTAMVRSKDGLLEGWNSSGESYGFSGVAFMDQQ